MTLRRVTGSLPDHPVPGSVMDAADRYNARASRWLPAPNVATVSLLLVLTHAVPAGAQTQQAAGEEASASFRNTLTLGGYYSRGDYGASADTYVTYLPLSWEHRRSPWRFRVTVPWLRISGPGNVLVNTGGVGRPGQPDRPDGPAPRRVRDAGMGDVLLQGTWELSPLTPRGPFVDIGVEVKLPTADEERGLGTGATDAGLQLDLYQQLGATTGFATLGYRWRGDSVWFPGLRDTVWASLGFSRPLQWEPLAGDWSWGMIFDYREAASVLSTETQELLPYVNWSPDGRWTLMAYLSAGLTRDSADEAVGVQLSWDW